jgi:hypothetical protein
VAGQAQPELSVVMVTPSDYAVLRKSVAHLREQSLRDRLELVLVTPNRDGFGAIDSELEGFWGHRVVELPDLRTLGQALAAGYRASAAPIVGYVEEHSFPEPGWASAVVDAHRGPWAAVGVGLLNDNPERMFSWAAMLIAFGPAIEPASSGETEALPSHHTHYKREVLAGYGSRLERMLDRETVLYRDLRRRGHRLYLEARARERHVNFSSPRSFMAAAYHGGRDFGAARVRDESFSPLQRLLYSAAAPLIVAVKLGRLLREVRRTGRAGQLLPQVIPHLVLGLSVFQLGETLGYITGSAARAAERVLMLELDRSSYVARAPSR